MAFAHTIRTRSTHVAAALLGCALAGTMIAPPAALAEQERADTQGGVASSTAFLSADAAKIVASVPTRINFAVNGDGTLVGPSAEALQIRNKSVFGIHVAKIKAETANDFVFVPDASKAAAENAVALNISPKDGLSIKASSITNDAIVGDTAWNLNRFGQEGSSVDVTMTGAVANVTSDLSVAQQFATINWTFAAGHLA